MLNFVKQKLNQFRRDDQGSITAEILIVMPLVALLLMASFIFFDSFKRYRDAQNITFTVSDIISRYTEIADADIEDLNDIFDTVMSASGGDTYLRVTSVTEYFGSMEIDWSRTTNGATAYTILDDLPADDIPVLSTGETITIVETSYPYEPGFSAPGITAKEYLNRFIVTPRFADRLEYVAVVAGS